MNLAIETHGLTKLYSGLHSVNHVNLQIPQYSIYGFLGPNGAGKSTTMKMILGLVRPSQGVVTILGKKLTGANRLDILRQTGSLIESPSYYAHLTGRENLALICMLKNAPESEIDRVLHIVRMENQKDKKAGQYSLGMKQRLGLAAALIGSPKLLLLDEPTNGLDPAGIQEMRDLICSLPKEYGITVMVSSHLLSEIDQMATHTGIIDKGVLIFQDTLSSLHQKSGRKLRLRTRDNDLAARLLSARGIPIRYAADRRSLLLPDKGEEETAMAVAYLAENQVGILRLEEMENSLEEIFLSLTGKKVSL
ncbi:MAG TPA: ATP-binding cassette domain-containing protein [Candidatus Blautia faecigallinarum]|uniref:ATP-binding cassette domain-containing protein n=1 Tax=Candidatus Blautia faecigallinarum TaxID=2838488 RepID=A0A9D2IUL6_9FIRM|nr:ATP-binding cassette domain-containing protein [Candidatus Blautia faecigallinarum]